MRTTWLRALAALVFSALAMAAHPAEGVRVVDAFDDASAWHAGASDQVSASAARGVHGGLCLRYDFGGVSGYAVLRRALPVPLELPEHYALTLRLSGHGAPNALQVKLLDASGDNVWWMNRPGFVPPRASTDLAIRQRQIEFAWGPTSDRVLRRVHAIELVVASGQGGRGELCFERLALRALPAAGPLPPPLASASSSVAGHDAARALDGDPASAWCSAGAGTQHWQVDFGRPRELAGLLLRFADGARASDLDVQFSDDGRRWHTVRRVRGSARGALALWLPESETRLLRLVLRRGPGPHYALAQVQAMGPLDWPDRNAMLSALAALAPRGRTPRAFLGEQPYWTLAGVDGGGAHAALVSEDGAIEPRKGGPSLEPFVVDEAGHVTSWADVRIDHALRDGYLPLPQVRWSARDVGLVVEAGADGTRERPQLVARYTLTNRDARPRAFTLALALRPWQVNPPRQFLNGAGGVAEVHDLAWQAGTLHVDGASWLRPFTPPDAVGGAAFDRGDALDLALAGALPPLAALHDAQGLAGALLRWRIELAPGASRSVSVMLPLAADAALPQGADERLAAARLDATAARWRERLNRVAIALPPQAQPLADSVRSALAQILMSRDGAALQPGTRSYARSWVRDGAMMVAGLLRLGETDAAREFVQWYAGKLFTSGKVPCCVDARGADPVAENDSAGEFVFAVAELWRHTRDRALAQSLWPQVDAAMRYMEGLRQSERDPSQRGRVTYGLMPASISHEGYSAK
ncbi:MAG TPA: discoidin domain-containing protein, partial [Burkholderiaceae bacterium]